MKRSLKERPAGNLWMNLCARKCRTGLTCYNLLHQRGKSKWGKFAGNLWTPMVHRLKTTLSNPIIIQSLVETISSRISGTYPNFMPNFWNKPSLNLPSPIIPCLQQPTMPITNLVSIIKPLPPLCRTTSILASLRVMTSTKSSPIKIMRVVVKKKRKKMLHQIMPTDCRGTKAKARCLKARYSIGRRWRCRRAVKAKVSPSLVHWPTMESSRSILT